MHRAGGTRARVCTTPGENASLPSPRSGLSEHKSNFFWKMRFIKKVHENCSTRHTTEFSPNTTDFGEFSEFKELINH